MKPINHKSKALLIAGTFIFLMGCQPGSNNKAPVDESTVDNSLELTEEQLYIGNEAPDFRLPDLQMNVRSLNDYTGKFLVIHFATTWCPFCNAEAPSLEQLNQDYKDKGVSVLIVDVRENAELVKEKLQDKFNFTFPILLDTVGQVAASYCPEGIQPDLPRDEVMIASNLIIDPEGKIQFFSLLDSKNFDAKLTKLKERLNELLTSG